MPGTWDLRTTPNPLIRAAGRGLARWNARHPWDHNAHFHRWILRSLPDHPGRVLDVGCVRGGLLVQLAARAQQAEGIDPDPGMARLAGDAVQGIARARVHRRTLTEQAGLPDATGTYDAVTMVASLHHQDLGLALGQARALLRPGGRLLVVALVRPATLPDHLWDLANALSNPLIGLVEHPRPVRHAEAPGPAPMPVRNATTTLSMLRAQARSDLPGAVIRRREGFRVTVRWERPGLAAD